MATETYKFETTAECKAMRSKAAKLGLKVTKLTFDSIAAGSITVEGSGSNVFRFSLAWS